MAEHSYFPRAFTVTSSQSPTANGQVNVQVVTVQDIGGDVVKVIFGLPDWEAFRKAVSDPEGFAAEQRDAARAAEARSRITLAGTPVGPQAGRRTKQ